MKRNAIASRVTTLINANKNLGTYPWQEPFTGDLFRLCKKAFDNGYHEGGRPLLTGDGLRCWRGGISRPMRRRSVR
jgi:hypothetical protein